MAIYLDHAATTPVHPDVREAMIPFLGEEFGNPSSIHQYGREIRSAVDAARDTLARSIHARSRDIIFTSGGTEADNTALIGVALANRDKGNHIITTAVEHHAVLDTCAYLETIGFQITYVPVDQAGKVQVDDVIEAVTDKTVLISVMFGNNEVGTIQPVAEIGEFAKERGIYFHTDAVQAFGLIPIDVGQLSADLLSISGHKINGPKGIGALYMSEQVKLVPHQFGGTQERKRRSGTENVPGIIGFGKAAEIALETMAEKQRDYLQMCQAMIELWDKAGLDYVVNGHPDDFLPHILNASFRGVDTEAMLMNLDLEGIACASGSACTAGSLQTSHVLQAMKLSEDVTTSAIRFSFGLGNTVGQVTSAAEKVIEIVKRLK